MNVRYGFLTPAIIFLCSFLLLPLTQLNGLSMIPGDIGDSRLNNYFLENIYQFFIGRADSLWHLSFFSPFPYVLGFSDNLFGSSPVYMIARAAGAPTDTAFQIWFLAGYLINFASAYYALRKLGGSTLAASIGAAIFAFALPTTAHAGHVQLHYRFGIPLALVYLIEFLDKKSWRSLVISGAWLVWQFYAGVYMGFFCLLLMSAMIASYFGVVLYKEKRGAKLNFSDFLNSWNELSLYKRTQYSLCVVLLFLLTLLLFFPYLQVSLLYGAERSWGEISAQLPRPQSYLLSDASLLWKYISFVFSGIPMRHEHQIFIGMAPLVLAALGLFVGIRNDRGLAFTLMVGTLGLTVVLTLYVGGFSLWYLFHKLPLASAIRAMTRLDQAILFPVAYLAVIGIDWLRTRHGWGTKIIAAVITTFLLFELSMTTMGTSSKESWRQRVLHVDQRIPRDLPDDAIIFMAQQRGPFFADELDIMWVTLNRGLRTLNGYSGLLPPNFGVQYGEDCSELPSRVISYLRFSDNLDPEQYRDTMSRVVPVGFKTCDSDWWETMPVISEIDRVYSEEEFRNLGYEVALIENDASIVSATVTITNSADIAFAAHSKIGRPIRLSWRFLDADGSPLSGWDSRKALPADIPAEGELAVTVPFDMPKNAAAVQVSMVQELVFWAHDIGIAPVSTPLK